MTNKDKIANGLRSSIAFAKGDTAGARVTEYIVPEPGAPRVQAFLRELGDLSRKYKLALNGDPVLFEMEPEDMATEYSCDDDSVVSFG